MLKKICLIGLIAAVFSFAQEETYIRNICDTLPSSATPNVELKMARVVETQWFGSSNLSKTDSSFVKLHDGYETVKPFRDKVNINMPYSITAGCAETSNNLYKFLVWNQTGKKWDMNTENDDYATYIMDINMVEFPGYNASNSYNILAMKKGALPQDGSYSAGELLVSRTYEFQFDWWLTYAAYKIESTKEESDGKVTTTVSWKMSSSIGMDSATSVKNAVEFLKVPDSVLKVQYQQFHVVLTDPNKKIVASSSSTAPESSSSVASSSSEKSASSSSYSGAGPWNCGDNPLLSCSSTYYGSSSSTSKENSSSSYVQTSSSEQESSSSVEQSTIIGRLGVAPRVFNGQREVRRLDGTKVKAGESLVPGIYYVKGLDGRWKKQIEF
jgi:hypothetical protein